MKILWTESASQSAEHYYELIYASSWDAAARFRRRLQSHVERLAAYPMSGREGRVSGTREITLAPWPYILVYTVHPDRIVISAVRHGAQLWPPHRYISPQRPDPRSPAVPQ
ncbi:addiction module toxin, RelE/StbE family [Terriglobus roseus DSM 18391]|uniref:Addiction module toxin, RelE/StbE family n=1 Tax=Terriglobus roseus (strain DSM 18391 / NRRL B-41598 / KBS 63) TaxID=926566 RepID=I3ZDT3_TERRK|nr:addiction module toxin, RelE/StbE family [Terriglobus roseus DSM 18391]